MRVEEITLRKLQMRLKAPFETSFGATDNRTLLLVEMRADGVTGWSEITAMETPVFNAETVSTATVVIREVLAPAVLGSNFVSASDMPAAFSEVYGTLKRNKRKFPSQSFLAALEMKSLVVFRSVCRQVPTCFVKKWPWRSPPAISASN